MQKLNFPTWLTLFRIILIPVFVIAFYGPWSHGPIYAAIIFLLTALTDWLDGFLARFWKQTTTFGAFLDPVADKIMIIAALILLVSHYHSFMISLAAFIIIIREVAVSALREWMAQIGKHTKVNVRTVAKIKTVLQTLSISCLIAYPHVPFYLPMYIIYGLLYVAVGLTIWSMIVYLNAAWYDLHI